jgi:hypothetical protein
LAGLDAFLAGFVAECVDSRLKFFLLILQSAHLDLDGLALVTFVELDTAGRRRWFTFPEVVQINELLVDIVDLPL